MSPETKTAAQNQDVSNYTDLSNIYLRVAFWTGEARSKIYSETKHRPLAAAHVAFGLLRENFYQTFLFI